MIDAIIFQPMPVIFFRSKTVARFSMFLGLILAFTLIPNCCYLTSSYAGHAQQTRNEPADQSADSSSLDLNLRVVWGGPKLANYKVKIELENGQLAGVHQLGIDADDSSFLPKDSEGNLAINDLNTRFGGCDLRVQAKANSKLKMQVEVADPITAELSLKEFDWSIKTLCDIPNVQELGLTNNRISIDRVPGDRLRVVTQRPHLIYNSNEPLSLSVQPYGLPWTHSSANLECTLLRLDDGQQVYRETRAMQIDGRGHGELYPVFANAPKDEGVYELRFRIESKRFLPGLLIRHPSIERTVQFVVYNNIAPSRTPSSRIPMDGPTTAKWQPQSQLSLNGFESQTLTSLLMNRIEGSKRFALFDFAKSFTLLSKEPSSDLGAELDSETSDDRLCLKPGSYAASSVSGLLPGKMHRMTLYSSKPSDTYRVSLTPNSARDQNTKPESWLNEVFDAAPTDSIAHITNPNFHSESQKLEMLFWPTARTAKLELTNLNATNTLTITNASVDVLHTEFEFTNGLGSERRSLRSVLELQSPNLRNAFGAEPANGSSNSPAAFDDWRVYLRFVDQIGVYCNANGFDCLALTVHSQGASLFPTSKLSSNPRYDTGVFSTDGRDPIRKDVVELLYRGLSRFGIEFVPMLELDGSLRDLEEMKYRNDHHDLAQHRESFDPASTKQQPGPAYRYNPLSPRVQQAMSIALEEFEKRYRTQANYRGFALRSTPQTHLEVSLPVDQTNLAILEQFALSAGGNLPKDTNQRDLFIAQRLQSVYLQWIKENVYSFLANLKTKPRWISMESGRAIVTEQPSTPIVSPVTVGRNGMDLYEAQGLIAKQWSLGRPGPTHIAMDRPLNRVDSRFSRLSEVANPFQSEQVRSLPYRDSSRSITKVRIWVAGDHARSLLLSNSGAVTESVDIAWETLPRNYRAVSTHQSHSMPIESRIDSDAASNQWRLTIDAGETVRVECEDEYFSPLHWYAQEVSAAQSMEAGLQSLEQAVTRLTVPLKRAYAINNPSFELKSPNSRRGRLVGWTTSIDSNTSVEIESRTASEGRASIQLQSLNAASIAWLQSDPFALTASDRLFVSFQAFAEKLPTSANVSLYQFDPKSDRFECIAVRDFAELVQRPNQQQWTAIGLDFSTEFKMQSNASEPSLYRIQFEAKGIGGFWLDDVSVSTSFLRETERRDLRSELFLARTSLQKGDSGPAVTMLTSSRGGLVQWGDSFATQSKVMVSFREPRATSEPRLSAGQKTDSGADSKANATKAGESKTGESKLRPMQRLRNSWWSRRD